MQGTSDEDRVYPFVVLTRPRPSAFFSFFFFPLKLLKGVLL
jgi:hypothetical protein